MFFYIQEFETEKWILMNHKVIFLNGAEARRHARYEKSISGRE